MSNLDNEQNTQFMDVADYERLLAYSKIVINPETGLVVFEPLKGFEELISNLVEKNNLKSLSMQQFKELDYKYRPMYQAKKKIREKNIKDFEEMSVDEVAKLPLDRKIEYVESLFFIGQTKKELFETCTNSGEKLKALLHNITFPKEFWENEEKLAGRFANLVSQDHKIVNNMKNWHNISLDEKKATIAETAKIIEYIYGSSLEIGFYTSEEYRKKNNLKEDVPVYGAYASKGKIFFNADRLADDNFMGVSVLFHEFMHKRQSEADFENQIVNRLFKTAVYNAFTYEQQNIDPASYEYGDFYSIIPQEVHAYGMQKFVESKIIEKTGIEKTQETASKTIRQIHEKSFAVAAIARYKSKQ